MIFSMIECFILAFVNVINRNPMWERSITQINKYILPFAAQLFIKTRRFTNHVNIFIRQIDRERIQTVFSNFVFSLSRTVLDESGLMTDFTARGSPCGYLE
ncbi:hypothetical protein [Oceanobacillus senegalensis]|uniref:hypothetical protein n=1 Tax=Oceanobacillus senegalensis TaxID=1936063 RepID=UPI000A30EFEB|nr:hypothetical protein [Oceanobacillus senegalensis]